MPRAGLTPTIVVDEAARCADRVGLDRLTLAAVAQQLGVALPSLYKHIRGLDGLQRELALRGIGEITEAINTVLRFGDAAPDYVLLSRWPSRRAARHRCCSTTRSDASNRGCAKETC